VWILPDEDVRDLDGDYFQTLVDESHIEQIVINIVANAKDAMANGGVCRIKLQHLTYSEIQLKRNLESPVSYNPLNNLTYENYILIEITDTGTGMTTDVIERIFEPFYTTKTPEKGTGLGLSIVYGLLAQENGFIDVWSTINRGTQFSIYLPKIKTKLQIPETHSKPNLLHLDFSQKSILIVEDDTSVRKFVQSSLKNLTDHLYIAKDGKEAIDLFPQIENEIDLVLSDIVMPEINGEEMTTFLLRNYPKVNFLLMSANIDVLKSPDLLQDPRVDFLQKPFTMDDLISKIAKIFNL
jgi:two-component system cell cycle sensor histidine kinase/response regulator CckA